MAAFTIMNTAQPWPVVIILYKHMELADRRHHILTVPVNRTDLDKSGCLQSPNTPVICDRSGLWHPVMICVAIHGILGLLA